MQQATAVLADCLPKFFFNQKIEWPVIGFWINRLFLSYVSNDYLEFRQRLKTEKIQLVDVSSRLYNINREKSDTSLRMSFQNIFLTPTCVVCIRDYIASVHCTCLSLVLIRALSGTVCFGEGGGEMNLLWIKISFLGDGVGRLFALFQWFR